MVQEDLNNKTISLTFKASRLTQDILKKAITSYLTYHQHHRKRAHGRISVKKLLEQEQGAATIPIKGEGLKDFERAARKYNVDFAIMKDKGNSEPGKPRQYTVFFKARDAEVITKAFQDFVKKREEKHKRPSFRKKLEQFKEQSKALEQAKGKLKEKKQELLR